MTDPKLAGPLVDVAWLQAHRHDADVRIVDFRWYLFGKNGRDEYIKGHVPGAAFLDLEKDLTARRGPGRHPIPGAGQIERAMRSIGVDNDTTVIVYDDTGGSIAARLWWLLRYVGHRRSAVLDGGLPAWIAAGGEIATQIPEWPEGNFTAGPPASEMVVDKAYVASVHDEPGVYILDARAHERYTGQTEQIDARPGHIPGAHNAPWANNLVEGHFKSPAELLEQYRNHDIERANEVIVYCGSGVTACHDLIALELAGIHGARLYEGSWSEWAADAALPAVTGDDPR